MLRIGVECERILTGGLEACTMGWGETNARGKWCLEN